MIRDADALAAMLDTVRRLVAEKLIPAERQVADSDAIPAAIAAEMGRMGLFGMALPEEFGGLGLTVEEEVSMVFELARAAPAFRTLVGTNNGLAGQSIALDGTTAQQARYLPGLASGAIIGAFALTEPEAGSDAAALRTTARREGDGYVIRGAKRFVTNGPEAAVYLVLARTDPQSRGHAGISAFLVPRDAPGLALGATDRKMGHRGSHTCDLLFDDCRVDAEALLGGTEGRGFKTAMKALDRNRLHISALCVGAAERLIAEAVSYARDRRQFGQPIGEFQLVQAMLADSRTEAYAARSMVLDAARRKDDGEAVSAEVSCCKLFASEMVGRVADRAVQILGGAGYMADSAVERFYRDVRVFRIYEGTSQIHQLIIARDMLRGDG